MRDGKLVISPLSQKGLKESLKAYKKIVFALVEWKFRRRVSCKKTKQKRTYIEITLKQSKISSC